MNAIAEYYRFFDQNRIYLPLQLCTVLEDFAKKLQSPTIHFGVYVRIENLQTRRARFQAWEKAWNSIQNDIPALRRAIENEFRGLLGVGPH